MEVTRRDVGRIAERMLQTLSRWEIKGTMDMRRMLQDRDHVRSKYHRGPSGAVHLHYLKDPRTLDVAYTLEYEFDFGPPPVKFRLNKRRRYSKAYIRCQSHIEQYKPAGRSASGNLQQYRDIGMSVGAVVDELKRLLEVCTADYKGYGAGD